MGLTVLGRDWKQSRRPKGLTHVVGFLVPNYPNQLLFYEN